METPHQETISADEGKSARGWEEVNLQVAKVATIVPRDRQSPDIYTRGPWGEPNFPNSKGGSLDGCRPKGFSVSPNVTNRLRTVIGIARVDAGDNIVDGDGGGGHE